MKQKKLKPTKPKRSGYPHGRFHCILCAVATFMSYVFYRCLIFVFRAPEVFTEVLPSPPPFQLWSKPYPYPSEWLYNVSGQFHFPWRYKYELIWDKAVAQELFPAYEISVESKEAAFNPSILCVSSICEPRPEKVSFPGVAYLVVIRLNGKNQCWAREKMYPIFGNEDWGDMENVIVFLDSTYKTVKQLPLEGDAQCSKKNEHGHEFEDCRLFSFEGRVWINCNCGHRWRSFIAPLDFRGKDALGLPTDAEFDGKRGFYMENDNEGYRNLVAFEWREAMLVHWRIQPNRMTIADVMSCCETLYDHPETKSIPRKAARKLHGGAGFIYISERNLLLGIGHIHRKWNRSIKEKMTKDGHHYTHSFFALSADPPYEFKLVSREFCFASPYVDATHDCEVVQFASGMLLRDDKLVISYGVNDCESRILEIPLEWALKSLEPVQTP